MKLFQKLVCMALTATATASLSICAFAADYTFDTAADTDYYPSTSYEDTYGTAYHYGSKNLVDYQIPELPYGVLSTTQTGVMEKLRLPGLQQTVGGSASGIYGVDSGVGIPAVTPVISSYQEPAYTSAKDMERKDGSIGTLKIPSLDINMKVDVDGPTRGRTIGDETRLNDLVKTMKVAVGVDVPRFLNEFMTRISGLAAKAQ